MFAGVDAGVIRLGDGAAAGPAEEVKLGAPRHAFDHERFETRLESLWFQRKTFLADGRTDDARNQLERIRALCAEEGVVRLEQYAGALVAEAQRYLREGNREQALAALAFAESFDPGRPQLHLARAAVRWKLEGSFPGAATEIGQAFVAGWARGVRELSLLHQLAFIVGLALAATVCTFACLMVLRHHVAFRHEVEEWVARSSDGAAPVIAGWAALAAPLIVWFAAGWSPIYWIVVTFRFMSRPERAAALLLLLATVFAMPLYNVTIALYGTSADPAVRTTIASADGDYDPDRIVKLQRLVEAHPDDLVYRFLLAGLYSNGRYFDEAFAEYKRVLELDAALVPAHVNIGNIFFATGQYAEATNNYRRATERDGSDFLAWFNLHLAQSESFQFKEAESSLAHAREIDAERVTKLLGQGAAAGARVQVQEARLEIGSVWQSAVAGRQSLQFADAARPSGLELMHELVNPVTLVGLGALVACSIIAVAARSRPAARRCIRCGNPFCGQCKTTTEGHEYCTQCLHLFVKRDGLAPGTKQRKLYEVERHERWTRRLRRVCGLALPGASHVLRGRSFRGVGLMLLWLAALFAALPWLLAPAGLVPGLEILAVLLRGGRDVPQIYDLQPLALLAIALAPAVWLVANLRSTKSKEA